MKTFKIYFMLTIMLIMLSAFITSFHELSNLSSDNIRIDELDRFRVTSE